MECVYGVDAVQGVQCGAVWCGLVWCGGVYLV